MTALIYSFPNLEPVCCSMSTSNCCFLTFIQISQEAGKLVWCSHLLQNFLVCYDPRRGFSVVNEAEVDFFFEFPCFSYDPTYTGNLISDFSAFSKSSWYIWKFSVHIFLKPSLKDFEHNLAGMWNKYNRIVIWTFLGIPFFEIGMKIDLFQSYGHCWVFQIWWHNECSTLAASSFKIWNS